MVNQNEGDSWSWSYTVGAEAAWLNINETWCGIMLKEPGGNNKIIY